jgi:hypothetical protein
MILRRRTILAFAPFATLAFAAACSATNGDAIPSQVYDASALDVGSSPDDPDAGTSSQDGGATKDGATTDAPVDSAADSFVPNTAPVQINELFVDNDGLGDNAEFVELRAAPGTPVDDLKLRLIYADGQVKYEVSAGGPGAKFPASGLWVVGGSLTSLLNVQEHVDRTVALSAWGLENDHGAVQVVRGTTLLDVVGYTTNPDAGALPPPASAPKATVEGSPVLVPDPPVHPPLPAKPKALSLGRKTAAADTNANSVDFCRMEASPGFAQKACQ